MWDPGASPEYEAVPLVGMDPLQLYDDIMHVENSTKYGPSPSWELEALEFSLRMKTSTLLSEQRFYQSTTASEGRAGAGTLRIDVWPTRET